MFKTIAAVVIAVMSITHASERVLAADEQAVPTEKDALTLTPGNAADEALVDIVALPQYCKKVEPARAAEFDARIASAIAKQPANIQALIATPEFQKEIAKSVVKMSETKEPEDVEFLKMACAVKDPQ